jgi:pilus assembly protein CpaD
MSLIARFILVGVSAASIVGCASPVENSTAQLFTAEKAYPIKVEPQVVTLVVLVDADGRGLSNGESDRIAAFAEQWKETGHGAITLSAPGGTSNQTRATDALKSVSKLLAGHQVPKPLIKTSIYPGAANDVDAPITLSFVTDTAVAAECGQNWSENMSFTPRNTPWPEFGCSTQHNFAAMLEDPRDLTRPRASDRADAMRRGTVLKKYREGTGTATTVEGDKDSGYVSDLNKE